ncbi:tetratricopeptide repeat protein [Haliea sp. E1-2-M8]|uniref:tetratricopeptide repeat protein n=1 Tax=Haliea sp. E1-2-M8 TaxID=3064706 RepID=UPI002720D2EA|nr:tetratricopeptide repeat protein [Haliea sp. E1-2-M8]MDO8864199.1 tetratricopeptide repeat protein [Haliea sp. E1-2-M8]
MKRRHVVRVLGAYAVTIWAILQVADIVLPALMAPDWVMTALVSAAVVGAPVAAVLAWLYDLTPAGVQKTQAAAPDDSAAIASTAGFGGRWVDYLIIAALVLILAFVLLRPSPVETRIGTSIAVLPFTDLSADQGSRYLGDGVAEAIMDKLARISGIQLSARTSSFSFRDGRNDARQVASLLGVETLLEGSVRRAGNQLRISARLIDGSSGKQVWSNTYDGSMESAFELQDNISSAIAEVMRVKLNSPNDLAADLATRNPQAFDEYLRGRSYLRDRTGGKIEQAIESFQSALALDPAFGLAAAGLCRSSWEQYEYQRGPELAEIAFERCEQTGQRYPELAETRIALGSLQLGTGRAADAEISFMKALQLEPNNAEAHAGLGLSLRARGEFEAAATELRKAIDIDPAYWRFRSDLGIVYYFAGELEAALDAVQQAIDLNPDHPDPYSTLGGIHFARGDFLLAGNAFEQSIEREPNPIAYSNAGTNYFFASEFKRAEAMFERAVEMMPDDFRFTGFLAWAIRAQPGRERDARPFHKATITTASERLAINVNDHDARAALAVHLAALDEGAAARGALSSLIDYQQLNINALTMTGFAHYFLGDHDGAIRAFQIAIDKGLPAFLLQSDPRLDSAWSDPRFAALLQPPAAASAENPRS